MFSVGQAGWVAGFDLSIDVLDTERLAAYIEVDVEPGQVVELLSRLLIQLQTCTQPRQLLFVGVLYDSSMSLMSDPDLRFLMDKSG
jgi:hypothetical protein